MKKRLLILSVLIVALSCIEDIVLSFSETEFTQENPAHIEINVPKAKENTIIANTINSKIETHIANTLNYAEDYSENIVLEAAIKNFNNEYLTFKSSFKTSELIWEAFFDGEVSYQSPEIITIPITSYLNTGGAHGNLNVTFLNFNPKDGTLLSFNEIIDDKKAFERIAKAYFKDTFSISDDVSFEDYFFGNSFQLPENIGFNEEGVILFYNVYEIASYTDGPTEFTIPFKKVQQYLKVN